MRCQRTDEGLIRFPLAGGLVVLAALIGTLGIAPMTPKPKSRSEANKVIDKGGEYVSPDGMCRAKLKIASMGGFLSLTAGESGAKNLTVNDITGMAWVGNHSLIYATSPIYGVPGLYVYGCESNKPRRIVGARTITGAYPDGADFFELERISDKKPVTVYFFMRPTSTRWISISSKLHPIYSRSISTEQTSGRPNPRNVTVAWTSTKGHIRSTSTALDRGHSEGTLGSSGSMRIDPTEEDLKVIQEIERTNLGSGPIPAALVRNWLAFPSLPVRAVAESLARAQFQRIEPSLSMEEVCDAVEGFYKECLIHGLKDSEYVPNRSIAGYELVRWFRILWKDPAVPREYLVRIKTMLRDLFLEKKVPMLDLVNSVLEHLFEFAEVQEFFSEWKSDPFLAEAYALAKEWGDDHLDNPLP